MKAFIEEYERFKYPYIYKYISLFLIYLPIPIAGSPFATELIMTFVTTLILAAAKISSIF